jgi:aspartyl-tRNA(Asn)/glutamyl-tRNA(Gln) amidotransferase subunit A
VFARTVIDAATLIECLAGHDPVDPYSSPREVENALLHCGRGASGMSVGVIRAFLEADLKPEAGAAFEAALGVLRRLGAKIQDVEVPALRFAAMTSTLIKAAEFSSYHRRRLREHPEQYGADVRGKLYQGATITAGEYVLLQRARRVIAQDVRAAFAGVDVLAAPTMPGPAPRIDAGYEGLQEWPLDAGYHQTNLIRLPSLLGLPTISVPCGWTAAGLPLGLELTGRPFDEPTVVRAAQAYEEAARTLERRPDV